MEKNPLLLLFIFLIVLLPVQGCSSNNIVSDAGNRANILTTTPSKNVPATIVLTTTSTTADPYPKPVIGTQRTPYPLPAFSNLSPFPTVIMTSLPTPISTQTSTPTGSGPCSTAYPLPTLFLRPDQKSGWCKLDHPLDETAERYGYRLIYPDHWAVRLAGVMNPNLMFNDYSTSGDKPEVFLLWVESSLPLDMADQAMSSGYELSPPQPLIDPLETKLQTVLTTIGDKQVLVMDTQREPSMMKYYFFILEAGNQPIVARFLFMVKVKVDQSEAGSDAFLHSLNDIDILVGSVEFYRKD